MDVAISILNTNKIIKREKNLKQGKIITLILPITITQNHIILQTTIIQHFKVEKLMESKLMMSNLIVKLTINRKE